MTPNICPKNSKHPTKTKSDLPLLEFKGDLKLILLERVLDINRMIKGNKNNYGSIEND